MRAFSQEDADRYDEFMEAIRPIYEEVLERKQGVWYTRGGMYSVVEAMEKAFRLAGGEVLTGMPATRIRVKAGKAVGVDAGGRHFPADLVVSNADLAHTYRNLLAPVHRAEFPKEWFAKARLSPQGKDPSLNYFGVDASQPLSYWRDKGWSHSDDPRGWFQWYCRYWMGRRCGDDERQIRRWKLMRRHAAQISKHCFPGDLSCRRRQRQALLHWAYDSRSIARASARPQ